MPKFSVDKGMYSSPNKDDCEPGLLVTLEDDEEITDALIQQINPDERYVTFTRENNKKNREKSLRKENPICIRLTKEGLRGRHFKRLHFSWITVGLRDEIFENVVIDSLFLGTPLDSPFEEFPSNIAKFTKNPDFVLKISGFGPPTYGSGFKQIMDEFYEKDKRREKQFKFVFYV